jgi:hypothetical protein
VTFCHKANDKFSVGVGIILFLYSQWWLFEKTMTYRWA